jgi:hypothetical protein
MPPRISALYEDMCLRPAHPASSTLFAMAVLAALIRELPVLLVPDVFATIRNLGVDSADRFRRLLRPLCRGERRLTVAAEPRHLDVPPVRQRGKRLKTGVYAKRSASLAEARRIFARACGKIADRTETPWDVSTPRATPAAGLLFVALFCHHSHITTAHSDH